MSSWPYPNSYPQEMVLSSISATNESEAIVVWYSLQRCRYQRQGRCPSALMLLWWAACIERFGCCNTYPISVRGPKCFSHQYIGQETATSIASIARLALSSSAPVRPPIWQCNTSRCKSLYSSLRPKCPSWIKRYQNRENARPKNAISSLREREEMCLYGCDVLP